MSKIIDLTGQRFGKWLVLCRADEDTPGVAKWLCVCDCGTKQVRRGAHLRNAERRGASQQCQRCTPKTHGFARSKVYRIWSSMKNRCENPKAMHYAQYGGRGIYVCDRWKSFENFLADMGQPPSEQYSIDRVDNDGPYSPENCRWATKLEQIANRGCTKFATYNGITKTVSEWAKQFEMPRAVLYQRIVNLGWPIEKALQTSARPKKKNGNHPHD